MVAVGKCDDGTRELITGIGSPKIRIVDTVWDEAKREGGTVFAEETNKAFAAISADTDWALYIQGDECVHEKYLPVIKKEMEDNLGDLDVEGLLFKYLHFYGSYDYYSYSRRWYRREVRVVRNDKAVRSYRDAQGFRINGRKLNVRAIGAYIYHYGWVKPPKGILNKMHNFSKFYHGDNWNPQQPPDDDFDYSNADKLVKFDETAPAVMQQRIAKSWKLNLDKVKLRRTLRRRILQLIEETTGWRIGEYKNYKVIK